MENKEIKNNAEELNDKMLEKVSGGLRLLVPICDYSPGSEVKCVICGNKPDVMINGKCYCNKCKP